MDYLETFMFVADLQNLQQTAVGESANDLV